MTITPNEAKILASLEAGAVRPKQIAIRTGIEGSAVRGHLTRMTRKCIVGRDAANNIRIVERDWRSMVCDKRKKPKAKAIALATPNRKQNDKPLAPNIVDFLRMVCAGVELGRRTGRKASDMDVTAAMQHYRDERPQVREEEENE